MLIITPDIVKSFTTLNICKDDRIQSTLTEHREILDQIIAQNPKGAQQAMKKHLQDILDFSKVN